MKHFRKISDKKLKEIIKIYPFHSNPEIAKMVKEPVRRIRQVADELNLRKNQDTISSIKSECGIKGNEERWH